MDLALFLTLAALLAVALFLYTFRNGCTDFLYLVVRNGRLSLFALMCLAGGVLTALTMPGGTTGFGLSLPLPASEEEETERALAACREFVTAKIENDAAYAAPAPPLGDRLRFGARSYWDTCAQRFGMNYWRPGVRMKGGDGGDLLCRAYRKDGYRSPIVESWCGTVLAPRGKG